jgi:pyrroloquinoline quinone (PQQ) biosynthesis protein C
MVEFLKDLNREIAFKWDDILSKSPLVKRVASGAYDKRLYAVYLIETFHYTFHNSKNQAVVATRREDLDPRYAKFCLKHAKEEVGHELMALHDLNSIGFKLKAADLPTPSNSTEVLIAYLYHVSQHGNPYRRLGYSFWAENVYGHIGKVLGKLQNDLRLSAAQMSFFRAHSEIDIHHAEEVEQIILGCAKKDEDLQAIRDVALTSLDLTARMLDEIDFEYERLTSSPTSRFGRILS